MNQVIYRLTTWPWPGSACILDSWAERGDVLHPVSNCPCLPGQNHVQGTIRPLLGGQPMKHPVHILTLVFQEKKSL